MPVPSHILSVPRPVNTIVEDRKTDSPKRYAVRARDGYTRSASGHIAPKKRKGHRLYHRWPLRRKSGQVFRERTILPLLRLSRSY